MNEDQNKIEIVREGSVFPVVNEKAFESLNKSHVSSAPMVKTASSKQFLSQSQKPIKEVSVTTYKEKPRILDRMFDILSGSLMQNDMVKTAGIVIKETVKRFKDASGVDVRETIRIESGFPEKMTEAEADNLGFFKKAKQCGWGIYQISDIDGGLGSIWYLEAGDDGQQYLVKQVDPMGEIVRRTKASLKKESAVPTDIAPSEKTMKIQHELFELEQQGMSREEAVKEYEKKYPDEKLYAEKEKKEASIADAVKQKLEKFAVTPPAWEEPVRKMKKEPDIENPWALAWWMKGEGHKPGGKKKKKSDLSEKQLKVIASVQEPLSKSFAATVFLSGPMETEMGVRWANDVYKKEKTAEQQKEINQIHLIGNVISRQMEKNSEFSKAIQEKSASLGREIKELLFAYAVAQAKQETFELENE